MSQSMESNMSKGPTTVKDVLGFKGSEIYSVRGTDSLQTAVNVLREKRIGAVLVMTDSGQLEGILSERDIVRQLDGGVANDLAAPVESVMTKAVKSCAPSELLLKVLGTMTEGRFRHMPVMDGDKVLGIVTIGDVVHYRLKELEHEAVQMKQMIVG
ncbi:MAG: CBS domain-containing protein [Pseudomonadota bacterium]